MNSSRAQPARGRSLRGGGGLRPQGVLDPPPPAKHGTACCDSPSKIPSYSTYISLILRRNFLRKSLGGVTLRMSAAAPPAGSLPLWRLKIAPRGSKRPQDHSKTASETKENSRRASRAKKLLLKTNLETSWASLGPLRPPESCCGPHGARFFKNRIF